MYQGASVLLRKTLTRRCILAHREKVRARMFWPSLTFLTVVDWGPRPGGFTFTLTWASVTVSYKYRRFPCVKIRERNPVVKEPPNFLLRWGVIKDKEQRAGTG